MKLKIKIKSISSPIKIIIIGGSQGASFFDSNINQIVLNLSKNFNLEISQQVSDESKVLNLKILQRQQN